MEMTWASRSSMGRPVLDQNPPVGFGERHAGAEFALEDFVFLPQEVVFPNQIMAEKLVNLGNQGVGRNLGVVTHRRDSIAASNKPRESKRARRFVMRMNFGTLQAPGVIY